METRFCLGRIWERLFQEQYSLETDKKFESHFSTGFNVLIPRGWA
jgi:hypothetical protein